ncbi:MAG: DMT family transporter [Paracoccaceae bacterium]
MSQSSSIPPGLGTAAAGNAICVLSMAIWAAGFPAAEFLLQSWPPLALAAARFSLATMLLMLVWGVIEGPARVRTAPWLRALRIGGLGFGLGAYLLILGQFYSDPVTAAVLATTMPVMAMGLEALAGSRRFGPQHLAGLAMAVLGGVIVAGASAAPGLFAWKGALCIFGSVLCFAWASRATVADFPGQSALAQTTLTLAGGMVAVVAAFAIGRAFDLAALPLRPFAPDQWMPMATYTFAAMALSQLLWIMGVTRLGIGIAAMHFNLAPFYVMLILAIQGAGWSWSRAVGAALVALGVVLAQRPLRR